MLQHSGPEENRPGDCDDNAVMESFFSTAKTELRDRFDSCSGAKRTLFNSIEVFYNQRRRHSSIDAVSPAIFERRESDQRAWTLTPLWTQRTRPQVAWKTAQNAVSHSAHAQYGFIEKDKERRTRRP